MPIGGEPLDAFERLLFGLPTFVGIDADRFRWGRLAQSGEVLRVIGAAHFEFQNRVTRGLENLSADHIRLINADAERGDVLLLGEAELEKIINRLAGFSRRAVE